MDVFLMNPEEKAQKETNDNLNFILKNSVKEGILNLLEYSYLVNYFDTNGSLVNSNWFVELINKLINKLNDKKILNMIKSSVKISDSLFLIDKNKLSLKTNELTDTIIGYTSMEYTNDQKNAITEIINFLPNYTENVFLCCGFAGVGKTTIIVEIMSLFLKLKLIKSIAFTAPTNKAVNVMKTKFKTYLDQLLKYNNIVFKEFNFDEALDKLYEINIKIDFITIHKLLKFEMDFGLDGDMIFVKNSEESLINQYDVIIIDECSMIPTKLIDSIFSELRKKKQKSCDNYKKAPKIIFSGDPAQLNPVNEKESILFLNNIKQFNKLNDNLSIDILQMKSITLKKVMRSKINTVTKICYQIRLWAIGEIDEPKLKKYLKNGSFAYDNQQNWLKKCLSYYKNGHNCNIILTWTNKQTDEYNEIIRKELFKKTKINRFEEGDILMLNDFYNLDEITYVNDNTTKSNKFYTSEQIKVIKIEMVQKKCNDFEKKLNKNAMKLQNSQYYESKYKQTIDFINSTTKRNYLCWKLTVKKVEADEDDIDANGSTIYIIHESIEQEYINEKEHISNEIKKLRKLLVSKFRQKSPSIETNIIKPLWREWHKNIIESFANINYGYSITCHKAQGSNFYNVFVDVKDILKNENLNDARKCLYVAVSRASNELHMSL